MVSDVEPMALPSRNVGGEFVGKVSVAGLLSKLDARAPYNGWIFLRWVAVLLERDSGKNPNGVQI
jgi:hypothetical protein